jgi:PAS domain-containing protein
MSKGENLAQEIEQLKQERDQARQALQASRTRFRNIIEKNADGVIVVNKEGVVRFVNAAARTILGRRADELLGEMFGFPMVVGDTTELDLIRNGDNTVVEMRVVESEWEGELVFLASLRDITERKRAEATLRCEYDNLQQI